MIIEHTVANIIDVDSLLEWCEHEDEYIERLKKSLYSQNRQLLEFEKENYRLRVLKKKAEDLLQSAEETV